MTQTTSITNEVLNFRHLSRSLNPVILLHLTTEGREANIKEAHALLSSESFQPSSKNVIVKMLEALLGDSELKEDDRCFDCAGDRRLEYASKQSTVGKAKHASS
ncbi:MAG: hypothetical protein KME42_28265 [Tildeniella nuda ZEHNDER 1965/U140]|jgi:vacuolar-type H+-ATPase subunit B/Vma2|nr:hypothetical protein [Tildeniella nuda ZEHNDER 1965/U140]